MSDTFSSYTRSPSDPPVSLIEITPSDTIDIAGVTLALNVATPGTVRVTTIDGSISDVTIQAGYSFPLRVKKVWRTGTSATGIRGLI